MKFFIYGNVPSKKNSRVPFVRNGRMMNFPSKNYVKWHKEALLQLKTNLFYSQSVNIVITLYVPTKRKSDLTNKAESIMDLLVDKGILQDDNYFCVPQILLKFGGVDREKPRAIIDIEIAETNLNTFFDD